MGDEVKYNALLKIGEAARILAVKPVTLRKWDKSGKLKASVVFDNGHRRYKIEDIQAFIARRENK